ncbi:RidA family protein [Phenylobacterium sp.]|uniref:RidA family protein n=1 Tax=Phenylobacterium sp. TaxID=1871053 RepID=UPI0035B179C7
MIEVVDQLKGYSQGAISPAGSRILWLSGHLPIADGKSVDGDLRAQAEAVFANLDRTIRNAGASWDNVLKLTYFVANLEHGHVPIISEVRSKYINAEKSPTTAVVGVARLANPDWLIEIDGFVALSD